MDRDEAFKKFQECVAEVLDVPSDEIRPEATWQEDLDADSLAVVEIILVVDEEFDIKVPDADSENMTTVSQAFELVWDLVQSSS